MLRLIFILAFFSSSFGALVAQEDDGPPIAITSPDTGTTFAYGTIESRALTWNRKDKMLSAEITFIDSHESNGQSSEDRHRFRFPGVTFDEGKKMFFATAADGEQIPVARLKKTLFLTTVEVMPNAVVRVSHPRGALTVYLEAVRPEDAAKKPGSDNPDGTHGVDIRQLLE